MNYQRFVLLFLLVMCSDVFGSDSSEFEKKCKFWLMLFVEKEFWNNSIGAILRKKPETKQNMFMDEVLHM